MAADSFKVMPLRETSQGREARVVVEGLSHE